MFPFLLLQPGGSELILKLCFRNHIGPAYPDTVFPSKHISYIYVFLNSDFLFFLLGAWVGYLRSFVKLGGALPV